MTPATPPIQRDTFVRTLRTHGFHHAAEVWRDNWIDFVSATAAWNNYPSCLDHYPTQLFNSVYATFFGEKISK